MTPTLLSEIAFEGDPTATYFDTVNFDDSCAAYWRFNGASTLDDEQGTSDGTFGGAPSLVTGLLPLDSDQALSFDGVDDYATVPSTSALLQAGSWTLEGLVKFSALPGALKPILTKGSLSLEIRADDLLQFSVQNHVSGVSTRTTVVGTTPLEAGTEYHVELIHDAAADELRIVLDGRVEATAAHSAGTELWGLPLLFGARHSSTAPSFGAIGALYGGTGVTSHPIGAPAGIAAGHVLICHAEVSTTGGLLTPPAGWQTLYTVAMGTNVTYVFYRLADAGDVGAVSYTFTAANAVGNVSAVMARYTGCDTSQPFANPPYANVVTPSGTSYTTGQRIPQCDDVLLLGLFTAERRINFTSSATERYDTSSGAGTVGQELALYTQSVGTSAATSIDVTASGVPGSGNIVGIWVALKGPDAQDFCAVTLDDWALLSTALDGDEALDHAEALNSGTGTWTDVTDDSVGEFDITRVRQYELDRMEPGSLTETLKDPNRDYDPSNTDGAYYPNVKTQRRHRVRATVGATTYPLFDGYITKWPPKWLAPGVQTVDIAASDGQRFLNLAPVTGSIAAGLTGAQIHRLLDLARWPRDLRDIDDGQFLMAAWDIDNVMAGASVQELVDSELGLFFMSAAGVATFHDYAHRWTDARSLDAQAIFSDDQDDIDAGAIPYLFGGVDPSFDDGNTTNSWTVSTSDGSSVTVTDVVGARQSFAIGKTRSTRLSSIVDAETQALALLQHTARAGLRFDRLGLAMGSPRIPDKEAAWATVLGLEISDRVTFRRTPSVGSALVVDCFVEGIEVQAVPGSWAVSVTLSPVSPASFYETALRSEPRSYYRMDEGE